MPCTIGDGDWSAKDLLGHIAFWEELAAEAADAWTSGRRASVEDIFGRKTVGVDAANAENQARTSVQSLDDVRARAVAAHEGVIRSLEDLTDQQWSMTGPEGSEEDLRLGVLLGRVLGAPKRPFGHAWAHLEDLRAYANSRESS